jgi:iron(III) transport system permease protein
MLGAAALWFVIFLLIPIFTIVSKVFTDNFGAYVGLANFTKYFGTPALARSIGHSFSIAVTSTVVAVSLAFVFAYGMTRTAIRGKSFFRYIAMLPLFVPTMVHAMGLISLFGKMGIVTRLFFDIGLYGKTGIIISEIIYIFPQAYLVLMVALDNTDFRLYEAASTLGASSVKTFFTVTLPGVKYGLISAAMVCFTLCFTDFGAPQVVGGNYSVLSTDIYKQVVGQQNMSMGAVVGVILTLPAIVAFFIDTFSRSKIGSDEVSSKAAAYRVTPDKRRDAFYLAFSILITLCVLALFAAIIATAITTKWPQNLALSFKHFRFSEKLINGGGISFLYSLELSLGTAVIGTIVVFIVAYLVEKSKAFPPLRRGLNFCAMLPMALPGLVIGLSYIMFFNKPALSVFGMELPNLLHPLYQTMLIMVLSNVIHMFSVTYVTATTALKKLDREYENVAASMAIPTRKLFTRVTLPLSMAAIVEVASYYFVNAMITVSAIVFLYSPSNKPASLTILNMDDNGDLAPAAAMALILLAMNIVTRFLFEFISKRVGRRVGARVAAVAE